MSLVLQGANEIRSYCVGHTQFVSCSAFISQEDVSLLATGSGDGSVRHGRVTLHRCCVTPGCCKLTTADSLAGRS